MNVRCQPRRFLLPVLPGFTPAGCSTRPSTTAFYSPEAFTKIFCPGHPFRLWCQPLPDSTHKLLFRPLFFLLIQPDSQTDPSAIVDLPLADPDPFPRSPKSDHSGNDFERATQCDPVTLFDVLYFLYSLVSVVLGGGGLRCNDTPYRIKNNNYSDNRMNIIFNELQRILGRRSRTKQPATSISIRVQELL